jgi:DNA polymerase III subunit delta
MAGTYLLLGPEKGLKDDYIKSLKAKLEPCEVSKFYEVEDYEGEMFAQLNNNDLFADHRLVIFEITEELKGKDKLKALANYIANPSDCATLVITSTELRVAPELMAVVPKDNTVTFYEMFENQKPQWLSNYFKRNGYTISAEACNAIIEKVENNVHDFENVCSQFVIFLNTLEGKKNITEEDVEDYLAHTKEETDFSLFSYVARRKLDSALECLHTLLRTKDTALVTSMCASRLASYFRRALSIQMNLQKGLSLETSFVTKYFENEYPIKRKKDKDIYTDACRNYSVRDLERCLVTLAEYDLKIKEAPASAQQTMMEKCLVDVIVHKGRHAKALAFATL